MAFATPATAPILGPVIGLILWSFVMWAWLYATRIPTIARTGVVVRSTDTLADMNAQLPPQVRWKADNYNHLMEQPTLFYATALALAVLGRGGGLDLWLAWSYVGLRVLHSLVQALVNIILLRLAVFTVSSIVLLILAIRLAIAFFGP